MTLSLKKTIQDPLVYFLNTQRFTTAYMCHVCKYPLLPRYPANVIFEESYYNITICKISRKSAITIAGQVTRPHCYFTVKCNH